MALNCVHWLHSVFVVPESMELLLIAITPRSTCVNWASIFTLSVELFQINLLNTIYDIKYFYLFRLAHWPSG